MGIFTAPKDWQGGNQYADAELIFGQFIVSVIPFATTGAFTSSFTAGQYFG
jgi:hypothetical protein